MNINREMKFQEIVAEFGVKTTPTANKSQQIIDNIRRITKEYVSSNNLKSLIVGVSGGLDSSVISALLQEKYTGVPLIGISIPMLSSTEHREQASFIGNKYCTAFEEFTGWDDKLALEGEAGAYGVETNMIGEVFDTVSMTDKLAQKAGFEPSTFHKNILEGNIKARLRMITLFDLARKTNGMVLSTDNLSEFLMAFWTIAGDIGDYGSIQNIGKGFELPAVARQLGVREDIITQPPSDGLMVTEDNTDEAQLGANYQEVDTVMYLMNKQPDIIDFFRENNIEGVDKINKVISRFTNFEYKRKGTINLTREEIGI